MEYFLWDIFKKFNTNIRLTIQIKFCKICKNFYYKRKNHFCNNKIREALKLYSSKQFKITASLTIYLVFYKKSNKI